MRDIQTAYLPPDSIEILITRVLSNVINGFTLVGSKERSPDE
jgi:hypothetical protein